jgi:RNA polymerase sigma-70 factor (ECF subfamily)
MAPRSACPRANQTSASWALAGVLATFLLGRGDVPSEKPSALGRVSGARGAIINRLPDDRDRQLMLSIVNGSAEALRHLYDRHGRTLLALARRVVSRAEDAEEVVQDVFTQVWLGAERYQEARGSVIGWLAVIARTRALDRVRSSGYRRQQSAGGLDVAQFLIADAKDPEEETIAANEAVRIREALYALPAPHRLAVDLAYYQGFTHSEIAEHTGTPLGTVKTRLRVAMGTLRSALEWGRLKSDGVCTGGLIESPTRLGMSAATQKEHRAT